MSLPRVQVTIRRGMQLPAMDGGKTSDPYVKFEYRGTTFRTATIRKTVNPVWNETFIFVYDQQFGPHTLIFEVWDANLLLKDKKMGTVTVNLQTLQADAAVSKVYPLEGAALSNIGAAVEIELRLLGPLGSSHTSPTTTSSNLKSSSGQTIIILTHQQAKAAAEGRILLQPNQPAGSLPVPGHATSYPPLPYSPAVCPSPQHPSIYPASSSCSPHPMVSQTAGLRPQAAGGAFYAHPVSSPPGPPYSGTYFPGVAAVPPAYLYPSGGGINTGTTAAGPEVCAYPYAPSPTSSAPAGPSSPLVPPSAGEPSPAVPVSHVRKEKRASSSSSSPSSSDSSRENDSDEKKHKKRERQSKHKKERRRKEKAADSVLLVEIKNIIPSATYGEIAKALLAHNNDKDLALKELIQNLKPS